MIYFVAITEGISAEGLARLFKDNIWKLYGLLESIVLDRRPHFAAEMTKKLNNMLGIKTKLLMSFHPQTDGQMEWMNQKLEQYLQFFVDHKQKDWSKQLTSVEFVINNKTHLTTNVSPFMANYSRELRIEIDFKRKEKMGKATEFAERV